MNGLYSLHDVGMRYNGTEVLRGVTLDFGAPEFVAIVGPNGAGKSTLLGIMAGLRPHYQGCCEYGGTEVGRWQRRAFARAVSFIPQTLRVEFPFTAEQVVLMGRTPHCDGLFEIAGRLGIGRARDGHHRYACFSPPGFSVSQRRRAAARDFRFGHRPGPANALAR